MASTSAVGDVGRRALDRQRCRALELDLRHDLEHGAVLEIAFADVDRLDARPAGRRQLLLLDRLGEARLHDVAQHFLPHLLAELLAHDFDRHLAGPEAFQPHGAAHPLQPFIHRLIDSSAGTWTSIRRSSAPVDSTETCMDRRPLVAKRLT